MCLFFIQEDDRWNWFSQLKIILVRYRNQKCQIRYLLQSNIDPKISSNHSACMISMQLFWDFILRISNIGMQIFSIRPPKIFCLLWNIEGWAFVGTAAVRSRIHWKAQFLLSNKTQSKIRNQKHKQICFLRNIH